MKRTAIKLLHKNKKPLTPKRIIQS